MGLFFFLWLQRNTNRTNTVLGVPNPCGKPDVLGRTTRLILRRIMIKETHVGLSDEVPPTLAAPHSPSDSTTPPQAAATAATVATAAKA